MSPPRRELTAREEAWLRKAWADPEITLAMIESRLGASDGLVARWAKERDLGPKKGARPDWSGEITDALKSLHAEKLSCQDIAARFYVDHAVVTTGNAVRSKLIRIGLVPHPVASKPVAKAKPAPRGPGAGFVLPVIDPNQPLPMQRHAEGIRINAALRAEAAAAPPPAEQGLRTLVTLEDGECRFPIGDPQHESFSFCGRKAQGDYCRAHTKRVRPSAAAVAALDARLGITAAIRGRA